MGFGPKIDGRKKKKKKKKTHTYSVIHVALALQAALSSRYMIYAFNHEVYFKIQSFKPYDSRMYDTNVHYHTSLSISSRISVSQT